MKLLSRAGIAALTVGALVASLPGQPAAAQTEPVTGSGLLAAPQALTPDDSNTAYPHTVRNTVTLDWAPVAGATGYRVQVGRDATWSDAPALTKNVTYSEWTLPRGLPNATYVWRVAALRNGALGHWSSEEGHAQSEAEFTKGWRAVPVPTEVSVPFVGRPTYAWSPVPDASGYELQVSSSPFDAGAPSGSTPGTDPAPTARTQAPKLQGQCFTPRTRLTPFADAVNKSGTVGDCAFASPPENGTPMYWRVRALDALANDTTGDGPQAASDAGISSLPPGSGEGELINCAQPELPEGSNCEPLRASVKGSWSRISEFTYTTTEDAGAEIATPVLDSVANDPDALCTVTNATSTEAEHAICRDVPTLRWSEVAGAVRYRIVIALDDEFTHVQRMVESSALQWTSAGSWADSSGGTSYYYAVQACSATSCGPLTSAPPSFSKSTPRLARGVAPATTGEMRMTWGSYADALSAATDSPATQDAFSYHLQVTTADDPYYASPIDEQTLDETFFVPLASYGDGAFRWRVQPVDSNGDLLPWTYSQSFSRDATAPRIVRVSPSSNVSVSQSLTVTFSETVTGVSSSTLTLAGFPATTVTSVGDGWTYTLRHVAPLRPGARYFLSVAPAVKDLAGNSALAVGPSVTVNPLADDTSPAISYSGVWRTYSSSNAIGGRFHVSTPTPSAKTKATMTFVGRGVVLTACKGPASGYGDLYVDNVRRARVNFYRSYSGCGVQVASITGLSSGTHTVRLEGIGTRPAAATGTSVTVDAFKALA